MPFHFVYIEIDDNKCKKKMYEKMNLSLPLIRIHSIKNVFHFLYFQALLNESLCILKLNIYIYVYIVIKLLTS